MARGGFVADNIEALRAMGLTGDDGQLLTLLKAADYNLERAVNLRIWQKQQLQQRHHSHVAILRLLIAPPSSSVMARSYFDGGMPTVPAAPRTTTTSVAPPPPAAAAGRSSPSPPPSSSSPAAVGQAASSDREVVMLLHDDDEEDEEEEAATVLVDQTIQQQQQLCKHGQGPDCPQCSSSSGLAVGGGWPKVLGQRSVDGYSVSRGGAVVQGERLHVYLEASDRTKSRGGGGGSGRGAGVRGQSAGKKRAREKGGAAATIRFRSQWGGCEGRLPAELAALLMPLLLEEEEGGQAVVSVEARALYSMPKLELFSKVPLRLRVSLHRALFDRLAATSPQPRRGATTTNPKARQQQQQLSAYGAKLFGASSSSRRPGVPSGVLSVEGEEEEGAATRGLREAVVALVAFLHTGKVEALQATAPSPPPPDSQQQASSSSKKHKAAAAGGGGGPMMASDQPATVDGQAGDGGEGGGDEEEAVVEESDLARLYEDRDSQDATRRLPEFQGTVPGLTGLELRGYQRQALQWMLQREEEEEEQQQHDEDGSGDGGGGVVGNKEGGEEAVVLRANGLVQVAGWLAARVCPQRHHELWHRHFLACLPPQQEQGDDDDGGGLGSVCCGRSGLQPLFVNPYSKRLQLSPPPPPRPCRGGILADAMGMGKTIMLLALLLVSKHRNHTHKQGQAGRKRARPGQQRQDEDDEEEAGTLVVVPLSLVSQWRSELTEHCLPASGGGLSVAVYYGTDRKQHSSAHSLRGVDVVLTTYGTLASDFSSSSTSRGGLYGVRWARVILDEAHTIKNKDTDASRAALALRSSRRWCVTGTPIQNALGDVSALLRFLRHEPWDDPVWWKKVIEEPWVRGDEAALDRLRQVLGPLLLRRTKDATDASGQRIVQLPDKHVHLLEVEFSASERDFYESLRARSRLEFEGYVSSGAAMQSYAQMLTLLLRLRQACDHPFLVLGRALEQQQQAQQDSDDDDDEQQQQQQDPQHQPPSSAPAAAAVSNGTPSKGHTKRRSAVTSSFLTKLFHRFTQGLQQQQDNSQQQQQQGSSSSSSGSGGGGPSRAFFESVAQQLQQQWGRGGGQAAAGGGGGGASSSESSSSSECPLCLCWPLEDPVVTPCCHVMCRACLLETLRFKSSAPSSSTALASGECPVCRRGLSEADLLALEEEAVSSAEHSRDHINNTNSHHHHQQQDQKPPQPGREQTTATSSSKETTTSTISSGPGPLPLRPVGGGGVGLLSGAAIERGSAKMAKLVQELDRLVFSEDPPSSSSEEEGGAAAAGRGGGRRRRKAVVFSQWTHMLDLVQAVLTHRQWRFSRLDGSLSQQERERALTAFRSDASCRVLLLSLKAGGVGLNLTEASIVFLLDPWWNPAVEEQAIDRVHRLGQRETAVHVFRLVVRDSVEQHMLSIQERKAQVAKHALSSGGRQGQQEEESGRLNLDDFKRFFAAS